MNSTTAPVTHYFDTMPADRMIFSRLLEERAQAIPDQCFFTFESSHYSYAEFNRLANRVARNLAEMGIGYGSVVAVLMDTSPDYLALWFALGKLGATEVPINTAYHGDILLHQLCTSGATLACVDTAYLAVIRKVRDESSVGQCLVRGDVDELIPATEQPFAVCLRTQPEHNLDIDIQYQDIGGIIFTSGTTGPSKGVLLSFRYLTAYGVMYADVNSLQADDVIMNFLPFFHMSGKFLTIATLVCGGQMRLLQRLSISTFLDEVRTYGITNFVGVGGICNMLLSKPASPADREVSIRSIYAVPDPDPTHHELINRFDCRITTVFGSTESGLPIYRGGVNEGYQAGSCGKASPLYDVRIVDTLDNEVPIGESGEIVVRPKQPYLIASGYVGMPQKSVEAWRNLWFHTGDVGRQDVDGWFYFEDRVSDSLRRRGENISSFEVEVLVGKHTAVSEVAAVAYPSELGEDEVRVFVIIRNGHSVTAEALFLHCRDTMPYFMVPRFIDIVSEFPRTPTAKIEKYKLRNNPKTNSTWDCVEHNWRISKKGIVKAIAEH
ncbi:AMP-binding protein [Halioxenophilus aromaticivorans]|uniref:ATP-dependent acyl-CoA ligase n=1 Tax=Halioxenophilus aromaticivorans TaxID=1306992 RepID=A0AAV3TXW4_9ALTE